MTQLVHVREFPADLEWRDSGDGPTATGLVVPFDRETPITEIRESGVIQYREAFAFGSCERAVRAPNRIALTYTHDDGFDARLGFGVQFVESRQDGGLVGTFRLDRSRAEHARDILSTSHGALSISFLSVVPKPYTERAGELVVRQSVIPRHVAAVHQGAYADALISSVRELPPDAVDLVPTTADVQAAERARLDADLLDWVDSLTRAV